MPEAQFHVSELRSLSLSGAQSGTSIDLTVTAGDNLDEVDKLIFSHPGITAELKTLDPLPLTEDTDSRLRPLHGPCRRRCSAGTLRGACRWKAWGLEPAGVSRQPAGQRDSERCQSRFGISHSACARNALARQVDCGGCRLLHDQRRRGTIAADRVACSKARLTDDRTVEIARSRRTAGRCLARCG